MTEEVILKVGLTPKHQCSYLGHEQEQLLVLMDHNLLNASGYERLLTAGFRRSGNDIYRPTARPAVPASRCAFTANALCRAAARSGSGS